MFMQIRKGMSEDNGHQHYALVSDVYYSASLVMFMSYFVIEAQLFHNKKISLSDGKWECIKFNKLFKSVELIYKSIM